MAKAIDPGIVRAHARAIGEDDRWVTSVEQLCETIVLSGRVTGCDIRQFTELAIRVPSLPTTPSEVIAAAEDFMRPSLSYSSPIEEIREATLAFWRAVFGGQRG